MKHAGARRALPLVAALLVLLASAANATIDEQYLAGLRQRRLYVLADGYCQARLARADVQAAERITLAIEWSRSLVEQAVNAPVEARDRLWTRAVDVLSAETAKLGDHPRAVLVRVQRALVELARGETALHESELATQPQPLIDEAREHLRASLRELLAAADLTAELTRAVNLRRGRAGDDWTVGELLSLSRNLNYQLAKAYRDQGQSYPEASPDRANSVSQAIERLAPLAEMDTIDMLAWQARLDQIRCHRLLGDEQTAVRRLDLLEAQGPPPAIVLGARAERARLALARGNTGEALAVLEAGRSIQGITLPELDDCWLEAAVAAWRDADEAGRGQAAREWQQKAAAMIGEIDRLYGPYWRRRAELLLARHVAAARGGEDPSVLIRAAEGFYRAGRVDEALTAYDRVSELGRQIGDHRAAFDSSFTAAVIEQNRHRASEAAERFRRLALAEPEHDRASDAHLLAVYNTAQEARTDATLVGRYRELLEEHLARWHDRASADQARVWLAKLFERDEAWDRAIELYRQVPRGSAKLAEAVAGAAGAYRRWLAIQADAAQPTETGALAASEHFERIVLDDQGQLPSSWDAAAREAAVAAADLLLRYAPAQVDRASRILSAAIAGAIDAPADWRAGAQGLLLFALARQGRRDEAMQLVTEIASANPANLLDQVEDLALMSDDSSPAARRELGMLALEVADVIDRRRNELDLDQRRRLDIAKARSLIAGGRGADALAMLDDLAARYPRDGDVFETRAQVLTEQSLAEPARLGDAYAEWLEIERRSRKGTTRWFRAIYALAELHVRLGDPTKAAQLIRATELSYPDLGGPELERKFQQLRQRIES